ncbi:Predicted dienelactone hydrolase [Enhydrobacter aerosaccus]|uniref:Predicted dienelactone hydrolase n=1 Tax=Enhydrobacter aerosaccus TaxID=225324 RepID=A0A1T4PY04_9HYPH|nr:dienelactone hydrolase [Enhydrobacter aerosaccus]SJZ95848.1 Predicted dienelactone hydrolase [Enhydrobacter aerosaccus]
MHASKHVYSFFAGIGLCLTATLAQAAGLRSIDIPADAESPAIHGMVWYPCATTPEEIRVDIFTLPGVKDCPLAGDHLPLIVFSHGQGSMFLVNHDTAETLADNGFMVAAINHPGDTAQDRSRSDDLSVLVERPTDIKRLIDFMIGASPFAATIDQDRIGFFGYSRGGYTGLVLLGADPDWAGEASNYCQHSQLRLCQQILGNKYPSRPLTHDPRIKVAVLIDPLASVFSAKSVAPLKVPIQLWASERGGYGVRLRDVAALDVNLTAQHEYRVVPNAGHLAFFLCPPALIKERSELCEDAPGFDRATFHAGFNAEVLAFFRKWLIQPAK